MTINNLLKYNFSDSLFIIFNDEITFQAFFNIFDFNH